MLAEFDLLSNGDGNRLLLGRDLRGISLYDLYRRLPEGIVLERLERVSDLPRLVGLLSELAQHDLQHLAVDLESVLAESPSGARG